MHFISNFMLRESSSDAASVLEINSGNMFVDDDTRPRPKMK